MSYQLVDFEDLYTAICEEIKVPLTDGITLNRIKRDINMTYLSIVVPHKPRAWDWLVQRENIVTYEKIDSGTVSVTSDSTTVTFSSPPADSVTGYSFKLSSAPDTYVITSHVAGEAEATLDKALVSVTGSGLGYKMWKDYASLPSDMKDVVQVLHDRKASPLEAVTTTKLAEIRHRQPDYEGQPEFYTSREYDADGNRIIRWFPACSDQKVVLKVEGRQEATALNADADEPLMAVEDRIVLFYGACSRAWARERNESEAAKNWNLFQSKLREMSAKSGDAPQITEMETNRSYLIGKRYRRYGRQSGRRFEND